MGATLTLDLNKLSAAVQRWKRQSAPGTIPARRAFLNRTAKLGVAASGLALLSHFGSRAEAAAHSPTYVIANAELGDYFREIQSHENAHVAFLTSQLGDNARPLPTFRNLRQSTVAAFIATSQALENTGVGAYLGAAKYILKQKNIASATAIALIEGRHAGFLNGVENDPITGHAADLNDNESFETPLTIDQVVTAASPFISSLNGGPALTFTTTRSAVNDTRILNFALALEQLEAAYYNINVPIFFPD